jgi:hypothetical protein
LGAERVCDSRAAALIFQNFKKEQKNMVAAPGFEPETARL